MDIPDIQLKVELKSEHSRTAEEMTAYSSNDQQEYQTKDIKTENDKYCNFSQKLAFEIKKEEEDNSQETDNVPELDNTNQEIKQEKRIRFMECSIGSSTPAQHLHRPFSSAEIKHPLSYEKMSSEDSVPMTATPGWTKLPTFVSAEAGGSGLAVTVPTPQTSSSRRGRRRTLRARRSLPLADNNMALLVDSGSDNDTESSATDDEDIDLRSQFSRLRQAVIDREEGNEVEGNETEELGDGSLTPMVLENLHEDMNAGGLGHVSTDFHWRDDFTSFTGQRETYRRDPGPTFTSQDPAEIFLKIWDEDVMGLIATETNKYARESIELYTDPELNTTIPKHMEQWEEVTIPVLYQYFALMICMSLCVRSKIQKYWEKGLMEMPMFRQAMTREKFMLISKFLHFASDRESTARGYARKIGKVAPILDHCNQKFSELYIPAQHISLDESLLLCPSYVGGLRWRQCIRSKAARFGIKSFGLCEATTGYLLKCKLYTGKKKPMHEGPPHGFANKTAQVVLELMEGYLDAGHVLVMDNWCNQLLLTRYLKSRCTDVLGTISRTRRDVPQDIKDLMPNRVARGDWYARHCGDISLVAWKDVKLVTVLSTYHDHSMVPGRCARKAIEKPVSVHEYNQYMGGVDLKDQKLSTFLFERKRCYKWYMKVFRRLVNTSLLNAFIIYTENTMLRLHSHRDFRRNVAEGLLARFGKVLTPLPVSVSNIALRLQPGQHFPVYIAKMPSGRSQRMNCVRCKMLKKQTQITMMCSLCQVALCVGNCWKDYHTRENLSIIPGAAVKNKWNG